MAKKFDITESFRGYRTKKDSTKLGKGFLVAGSQNVKSTDGDNVKIRDGYTLDGAENTASTPIESSFDWQTNTGVERNLRSYDDELEFRWVDGTDVTWTRIKASWTAVDFNFDYWWDVDQNKDILLFVNGDDNIYAWSGAAAKIGTTTVNTITLSDTTSTWAENRFLISGGTMTYDRKITINGTVYTYTGGETTNTLTGVTGDPTSEASGSVAIQTVTTFADSPGSDSTVFPNDLIKILNNQVWVGSLINNNVFVSKNTDFTDFSFSSPRVPGEGATLTLDGSPTAFEPQEKDMYISAGKGQWYKSTFTLSDDNTAEALSIIRLKTGEQQSAISQGAVTKIKNAIVFMSKEPTFDTLGRVKDINTPQDLPLSDPIKPDFDGATLTGIHTKFHRNIIYITLPSEGTGKLYSYNIEKGFWEPPSTLKFSRLAIIDGELYAHSGYFPETYKLFDGLVDRAIDGVGSAINAKAIFSYRNFGDRAYLKSFDEYLSEGKISANTTLNLILRYDFKGSTETKTKTIDGSDTDIIFGSTDESSFGRTPFGRLPHGGRTQNEDIDTSLNKFRQINTEARIDFHELQVEYNSNADEAQWELLSTGGNVSQSSNQPVSLKK